MLMEVTYIGALIIAAGVGAVAFLVEVKLAPSKTAPADISGLYTGLVGAGTTFLGSLFAALTMQDKLIKRTIKRVFKKDFLDRRDGKESDAGDAVALDTYGAQYAGEQVDGWGWAARRLRASQLKRAVDAGYLTRAESVAKPKPQ